MQDAGFSIRPMKREEVPSAVELAVKEGWNPGLNDGVTFIDADPDAFLIGLLDDRPVGCISALSIGDSFGYLGYHLVARAQRGRGYDLRLWEAALKRLDGRVVGFDCALSEQDNYLQAGFKTVHTNIHYRCPGGLVIHDEDGLMAAGDLPFEEIEEYDRRFFPATRGAFLKSWFGMPRVSAFAIKLGDHLCGYGVIRPCREGWQIGPLFADNGGVAERLYRRLSMVADANDWVYIDIPESNRDAVLLAGRFNMTECYRTARMYLGDPPTSNTEGMFGIVSFQKG